MAMNAGQRTVRRLTGFLPLLVIAALFAAPLVIWLVKGDDPPVVTERLRGRVVAIGAADQAERRVVVDIEGGMTVIIRTGNVLAGTKIGDDVEVLRSTLPTGEIDYELGD